MHKIGSAVVTSDNPFPTLPPRTAQAGVTHGPEHRDSARTPAPRAAFRVVDQAVARRVLIFGL